jgi:hypothetical protein
LRVLIRRLSIEKPLWGAPRIHGELLKLGFEIAQSSVAKHMVKRQEPPSQGWRTFMRNHACEALGGDTNLMDRQSVVSALCVVFLNATGANAQASVLECSLGGQQPLASFTIDMTKKTMNRAREQFRQNSTSIRSHA